MEIKKIIIPVAGLGTRFLPLSRVTSKEFFPLVDKPIIQYIIEEVKRMSYDLMPAVLDEFGLVNAIRNLCEEIESRNNITVKYTYNIEGDKLNRKVNTYIFRMVQEGMNNIVKHAKATNINIELLNKDCNINLLIEDNGIGFNIEERISTPNTNGIYNMRERANLLSGKLEITSKQGIGTRITAVIPINEI